MDKNLVLSCTNAVEGGVLTVARAIISEIVSDAKILSRYKNVFVFVNSRKLFGNIRCEKIIYIEAPFPKANWVFRIIWEYIYYYFWSKKKNVETWFSLHDVSPNVVAENRIVYFHQPAPFYNDYYRINVKDIFSINKQKKSLKMVVFSYLYQYLYKVNASRNKYIIVQQQWIRNVLAERFGLNKKKILVAYPQTEVSSEKNVVLKKNDLVSFVFVSFPREYKNFEVIIDAVHLLNEKKIYNFFVNITMSGKENRYSKSIMLRNMSANVKFLGLIKNVDQLYIDSDILIFPSKVETWGLPLSEFAQYKKPIIASNLPYAKETLNGYLNAIFFDPDKPEELAGIMEKFIRREMMEFPVNNHVVQKPFAHNWKELVSIVLS